MPLAFEAIYLSLHFIERRIESCMKVIRAFLCPQNKPSSMHGQLRHLAIGCAARRFHMRKLDTDFVNILEVTIKFSSLLLDVVFEVVSQPHITCNDLDFLCHSTS